MRSIPRDHDSMDPARKKALGMSGLKGCDTKSSLLLDFRRGAQCVPPVCVVVLLGSDGEGASKWPSLKTAETAVPPSFALQSLISK